MFGKLRILGLLSIAALAIVAIPASAAQAAKLTAGAYADTVYGTEAQTNQLLLRDNSNLGFTCAKAEMAGDVPGGGTSSPVLHPWFEGCTAFGLKATLNTTGCDYRLNFGPSSGPAYPATWDLVCSTSGMVLTTLTCEVVFPSQSGLTGVTGSNEAGEEWDKVLLKWNLEGIDYVVTKDGIGCPLKGKGNYSEAAYGGSTQLSAWSGDLWLEP